MPGPVAEYVQAQEQRRFEQAEARDELQARFRPTPNYETGSRPDYERGPEAGKPVASTQISGEGSGKGTAITGNAWSNKGRVTGVDGNFSSARNPTERGPKAKPFAGSSTFKAEAKTQETSQLVTGSFSKTGARVTLSGGAQT